MLSGCGGGPESASSAAAAQVAGAVLAGGRARRMGGGSKACVALDGRPLLAYPLAALGGCGVGRVGVVCKRATDLPPLPEGVERWEEPDEPSHPATGVVQALESAAGPVLVIATDMPWVGVQECRALLACAVGAPVAAAVVATTGGRLQPVLGLYRPAALPALAAAVRDHSPLMEAVEALGPGVCELPARALRGVNTRAELAAGELAAGG